MATISGRLLFDRRRLLPNPADLSGIANVPIVLQNINTGEIMVTTTAANGGYTFMNVSNGEYRIVEAFGYAGGTPVAAVPPLSFVSNPPSGATNLDCVTPNTLIVTVSGADLTEQNFYNGPVTYTSINALLDECAEIQPGNLITAADNGTFGFFPPGTPANTAPTIPPVEPYPGLVPDFEYVLSSSTASIPDDGQYTIQNIMNNNFNNFAYTPGGTWWRIADHTTGNETGRFMLVNGYQIDSVFFRTAVAVIPNIHYLFSSWIINVYKYPGFNQPAFGVRITGNNTGILYEASLGVQIPTQELVPQWKQIGTNIYTGGNTNILIEFISLGEAGYGNDYAIDDVRLSELTVPRFIPVKSANKSAALVGDIVTFTIVLENDCSNNLTSVFFRDILQEGLLFVPDSLIVNGTPKPTVDPNDGFLLDDIPGGGRATLVFEAEVTGIPPVNPIPNTAVVTYEYTPVLGGIPTKFEEETNTVFVEVAASPAEFADLSVVKTASALTVLPGDELIYTIIVRNAGPATAVNVILTDIIPPGLLNPEYSVDGFVFFPWPAVNRIGLSDIPPGEQREVIIRGTVAQNAPSRLINTAVVSSETPDPNLNNNTSTVTVTVITEVTGRCQAITGVMQSSALQEAAIAHILNAEGEKIQEIVAMLEAGEATVGQATAVNSSAARLVESLNILEAVISSKLNLLSESSEDCTG
jgi:uncharacterized repeat protein (TIGR01451 family)